MDLRKIKKSILSLDSSEQIAIHRAIRLNRVTSKRAIKEAVKKEKKQSTATAVDLGNLDSIELQYLLKKLEEEM
jgi:hypothetical protein